MLYASFSFGEIAAEILKETRLQIYDLRYTRFPFIARLLRSGSQIVLLFC